MTSERAETYLRQLAEAELRRARTSETAADGATRVSAIAVAFEAAGVLDGQTFSDVVEGFRAALAARGLGSSGLPGSPGWRPFGFTRTGFDSSWNLFAEMRRAQRGAAQRGAASARPSGPDSVTPVGALLTLPDAGEDVYLLGFVAAPGRAWLSVAARTTEAPAARRVPHALPLLRRLGAATGGAGSRHAAPKPSWFPDAAMTAVDNAAQHYSLHFSGRRGAWYLGLLALSPDPPQGITWLQVSHAGQSVRIDLTAGPPRATVSVHPLAASPGEAFLRQRAEMLLHRPELVSRDVATMTSMVAALRAVGALPAGSPVPGEVAALCERLGSARSAIADAPDDLPERWASVLAAGRDGRGRDTAGRRGRVAAANLAVVLPEADGVAVTLAGLIIRDGGRTSVLGVLHPSPDFAAGETFSGPSMWLRDDSRCWHGVFISHWGLGTGSYPFQAEVVPPLPPATGAVELFVTGPTAEVRAAVPLTWWRT